uniref:Reverse transcriptase Ty1/copia-type domain-containing protein n=1 Tax=Chromera velia CCMP2878 TaxID=1169474 RepID=A0A0G4HD37_9ALVE|eukprot:Cvel_26419.t1-p1 / transcript=Cvel_26419.t1 / gene=Cvel_26419 / organism=Chromera_velia_CCMP2878 / gene_product=hypothetical protein / transcript_product=hypothetical protein / location=Cvel_scaffold3136:14783-17409(-) / protein_length=715 / sequence_SO=supercontig / SO=protein_coding / is_pseudo=false
METEAVTLPLIGNQRLINLGVRFDYQTGSLELPSTVINFLRTENDLFFLPLEIDMTSPPESPPVLNSHSVSPEAVVVGPGLPVSPPLSPSPIVLANGHLPARLKAAKQRKHQRGNRTQSHVVQAYSGESAVSPPVSSSCDSFPASAQQPQSSFLQDPPPISIKATVDELIRAHHEWLGHAGIEATWHSLRASLSDLLPGRSSISCHAVQRALLPCIRGGTCAHVKPRHGGDGTRGSLKVDRPGQRVCYDLVMGLKGGYSLHIQDQHDDWLAQEVVETKDSTTIRAAYDCWSRSLEGDLTPEVMTDHGPEFQGDWCEWLAEREATNPLTPRISEHVFRLRLPSGRPILLHRRCIRPNDSPNPDPVYVVPLPLDSPLERADTSVGSSQQQQEQQQQQSSDSPCSSAPHSSPKFNITDFGKDELIFWRDENTGRCFLSSIRAVDPEGEGRVEVQAWGSNGKQPLASRRMQPAWCPLRGRPKLLYGMQKPSGCGPEFCFLVPEEVVERNIVLSAEGTLPSHFCDTYRSVLLASPETVFPTDRLSFDSLASSAPAAAIFPPPPHPTPVAGASVVYLWNEDDESLADNDAYKRVPIAKVDAEHRRSAVPTHFVDTEKHVEEGAWTYKSRVVADGTPFFNRREGVTTSCATASQSAIRIALAMAFAHSDFDPREIVVADVKTAYLTALRSDSLYVHPSKDHPDHGQFLWLLNRALYGLRDSG